METCDFLKNLFILKLLNNLKIKFFFNSQKVKRFPPLPSKVPSLKPWKRVTSKAIKCHRRKPKKENKGAQKILKFNEGLSGIF
jgi:hypothetical protein